MEWCVRLALDKYLGDSVNAFCFSFELFGFFEVLMSLIWFRCCFFRYCFFNCCFHPKKDVLKEFSLDRNSSNNVRFANHQNIANSATLSVHNEFLSRCGTALGVYWLGWFSLVFPMTSSSSCYNDFRMILYTLTDTPESPCLMLFYWVVGRFVFNICNTHRIHVWNIYLHFIYHKNQLFMLVIIPVPWILWYRAISEIRRKGCVKKLRWKFCHDLANVFDTLLVWAGIVAWAEKPGGFWKFFGKQHIGGSVLTVHHKIYIYIYHIKYKHETKPVSFQYLRSFCVG